jgi:hypothetical protein
MSIRVVLVIIYDAGHAVIKLVPEACRVMWVADNQSCDLFGPTINPVLKDGAMNGRLRTTAT